MIIICTYSRCLIENIPFLTSAIQNEYFKIIFFPSVKWFINNWLNDHIDMLVSHIVIEFKQPNNHIYNNALMRHTYYSFRCVDMVWWRKVHLSPEPFSRFHRVLNWLVSPVYFFSSAYNRRYSRKATIHMKLFRSALLFWYVLFRAR